MSASHAHALDAIAFQLAAALEQYDQDTATMVARWPDLENYHRVSEHVERIRMYSSALDEARPQWVELLIAHAELGHLLWRVEYGHDANRDHLEQVRLHHADCTAALRNLCLRLIKSVPPEPDVQLGAGATRVGSLNSLA